MKAVDSFVALALASLAAVVAFLGCHASPETSGAPGATNAGPSATSIASTAAMGMTTPEQTFHVDAAPAGACAVGAECAVVIHLVADGKYHVNTEYPYRFVPKTTDAGVSYLGTSELARKDEKSGTVDVRFKPSAKGNAKIAGIFKLSVCSKEDCKIEEADIALDVPVR